MLPPAPGRSSTTTPWPHASLSFCARSRATTSVAPPAAKGTMMRTGRAGHASALARDGARAASATARQRESRRFSSIEFLLELLWRNGKSLHSAGEREQEPRHDGETRGERGERLLPFAPRHELEREEPHAAGETRGEEHHEDPLPRDHPGPLGPAQESVQARLALQRHAEREEREPVHEERPIRRVIACRTHHADTASTARSPSARSTRPMSETTAFALAPRQPSHSAAMLRSPIAPWIEAARTKSA